MQTQDYRLNMPLLHVGVDGLLSINTVKRLTVERECDTIDIGADNRVWSEDMDTHPFFAQAVMRTGTYAKKTDISVDKARMYGERLERYQDDQPGVWAELCTQAQEVQPIEHFAMGTELWYVYSVESGRILTGKLREVDAFGNEERYGKIQYKNGYYPGVTYQANFFDSEQGARDALAAMFSKRFPGNLDQSRVKIESAPQERIYYGD